MSPETDFRSFWSLELEHKHWVSLLLVDLSVVDLKFECLNVCVILLWLMVTLAEAVGRLGKINVFR